jgi:molecular chaperone GrpE (heat shock protein)
MRAKKQVLRMKADMENMRSTYEKKVEYLQTRLQKKEEELLSASGSNVHA